MNYCKTNSISNACIFIQAGTYYGNLDLLGANNICLFGIGTVYLINTTAAYPKAALNVTGVASFYNIVFRSQDNATNAYGLHIEGLNDSSPSTLAFYNCTFQSTLNAGAGIGTGSNYALTFNNCRFLSNPNAGLFIHNYGATGVQGYHEAYFLSCRFTSYNTYRDIIIHDAFKIAGLSGSSPLMLVFANCTSSHGRIGYSESSGNYIGYLPPESQITLNEESNSSILGVNNTLRKLSIGGIVATNPSGVFTYPLINANKYDIQITSALNQNNENILNNCAITGKTNTFFVGTAPASSGVCNMNFVATVAL